MKKGIIKPYDSRGGTNMGPIQVVTAARNNASWEPTKEEAEKLLQYWEEGKLGTIAPDLLKMYLEDAIPISQISKAWKIPSVVIEKMYAKAGLLR